MSYNQRIFLKNFDIGTILIFQLSLFDEMIEYIQNHKEYSSYRIRVNAFAEPKDNLDFLKKRGFIEKNVWKTIFLPLAPLAEAQYESKLMSKIGTKEEIPSIVDLIKKDGRWT